MYKEFSLQFISQLGIFARAIKRAVLQLHDDTRDPNIYRNPYPNYRCIS